MHSAMWTPRVSHYALLLLNTQVFCNKVRKRLVYIISHTLCKLLNVYVTAFRQAHSRQSQAGAYGGHHAAAVGIPWQF